MKNKKGKYVEINQPSVMELFDRIPDEDAARNYLESGRWPNGIKCIHCKHDEAWKIRGGKLYTCRACRKQFTIRTGTVMEDSKIPLKKWIFAMCLMTVSRKGISSIQLAKQIGVTQKSAWFMAHRIRESCQSGGMISGTGGIDKIAVFGLKSRNGEVRVQVVDTVTAAHLHPAVNGTVAVGSTLYTDKWAGYHGLTDYQRETVDHMAKEYVRGDVHTNSIESFWAILKRAHKGTFHK